MAQHFLLSAAARTLSLREIYKMSDDKAFETFKAIRFAENGGEAFCPDCGSVKTYWISTRRRWKCAACLKLEERYVGPPLGTVLSNRTPAYVMNMILNPDEMVKNHPEAKAMLAQFLTPMPNQNLTEDEARAVLEYLRDHQEEEGEDEEAEDSEDH